MISLWSLVPPRQKDNDLRSNWLCSRQKHFKISRNTRNSKVTLHPLQLTFIKTTVIFTVQRWVFHSVKALLNPSRLSVKKTTTLFPFFKASCNEMLFIRKMFILQKIYQLIVIIIIIIINIFCISKHIVSGISQVSKQLGRRVSKFASVLIWMPT